MQYNPTGQCSIPVFEGLLPEPFNGMVLRLLYKAAEWHALAKLRMHTDSTLGLLEVTTREFGQLMRQFRDRTSDEFNTVELPRKKGTKKGGGHSSKKKTLNLNTYKFHSLGDYVKTIRLFGTTDSYSTQVVSPLVNHAECTEAYSLQGELAHRVVKRLYGLTNKKNAAEQISRRYQRTHHFNTSESLDPPHGVTAPDTHESNDSADNLPELHHTISRSLNNPLYLASFSSTSTQDPAAKVGPDTPQRHSGSHCLVHRTSFTSSVSISLAESLARVLTVMTLASSQMKRGTQSESSTISFIPSNDLW